MRRVIKFNQKAGLKQCIDINTKLRRNAKNDIDKDLFKLMNNLVFCKNHEKYGKRHKIYQSCNYQKKIELFSVRTKLSYSKMVFKIRISNRK